MQYSEPLHLFVYGTLRRGSRNEFAKTLSDRADFMGGGRVHGKLYDFGAHPAMIASQTTGWVRGEVFRLKDMQLLAELDIYEGVEFDRVVVEALLDSGAAEQCWVYVYLGDVSGRAEIPSGEYPAPGPEPRA